MRDTLERVTIVLSKEQHCRFREFARRYHGSVSQFLRMAAENAIDDGKDKGERSLLPLLRGLERTETALKQIDARISGIERQAGFLPSKSESKTEVIAEEIERFLLTSNGRFSVPELGGYLPYSQEEIVRGIELLEERFAVSRIKQVNGPSKWKIRGDNIGNT